MIRVLLIDRGFLDGLTLWQVKHLDDVDFVVPAKDGMHVKTDARAFLNEKPDGQLVIAAERPGQGPAHTGHVKLIGVTGLTTYDQYGDEAHQRRANRADFEGHPLNAVVVTEFEHHVYAPDQAKVFLTSLPITDALAVLDLCGLRSLIKNTLFRELKQGWFISRFPKKTADAALFSGDIRSAFSWRPPQFKRRQ